MFVEEAPSVGQTLSANYLIELNEKAMHAMGKGFDDHARKALKLCEHILN